MPSLRYLTPAALAACLFAAACSTPQTPATPGDAPASAAVTPHTPPQPMQDNQQPPRDNTLRAGRVSQLSEDVWIITPEDNAGDRLCLHGPLAEGFQTPNLRIQFRGVAVQPGPNERWACQPMRFKFIGELPEGATPDDSDIEYEEQEEAPKEP